MHLLFPLFFLFTAVPLFELYLLFQVADVFGGGNTFLLVIVTGFVGAYMARSQGQQIMLRVQTELASGGVPADSLVHGLLVFLGGVLLITPGIVTDFIGFCFVIPVTRWFLVRAVKTHFQRAVQSGKYKFQGAPAGGGGGFRVYTSQKTSQHWSGSERTRDVVEVTAERIED